ncbi:MAG: ParB N-terminal domain-containing protein, partial [Paracoccaceae bacterium]
MASNQGRRGLGRGLSALMADVALPEAAGGPSMVAAERQVPIESIHPNPGQPRRSFTKENLEGLANSIREKGVLQPLIVRKSLAKTNGYEIVAGER